MSSKEKNTDQATEEFDENDEDTVITMPEFIEEEQRLENDADALLGPSDLKNCTYNKGYMKRQALYSCRTCSTEKPAGVCVACSYQCHEGHDLVELYTKRNFRCDCGNSRFGDKKCSLEPNKENENIANSYNQNFEGKYCTCARPYPDPEDTTPDTMIQCSACEDWYHTKHITSNMPTEDQYGEMICHLCTEHLPFLQNYTGYAVTPVVKDNGAVDVEKKDEGKEEPKEKESQVNGETNVLKEETAIKTEELPIDSQEKTSESTDCDNKVLAVNNEADSSKETEKVCMLEKMKPIPWDKKEATFWPNNFRSLLCSCDNCKEMYTRLGVSWIIDDTDSVSWYEANNKGEAVVDNKLPNVEQLMSMMDKAGMDRFTQVEAIHHFNDLKTNLMKYLAKFAENKKVVREKDIHEFFTQMRARKRQKLNQTTYTCR